MTLVNDDQIPAASQPASTSQTSGGPPAPGLTRRNFLYGSAAAAAVAFLPGFRRPAGVTGGPAGVTGGPARLLDAAGPAGPLFTGSPYVCGQIQSTATTVTLPVSVGTNPGDAIVVCVATSGHTATSNVVSSVTDSVGNSYPLLTSRAVANLPLAGWIYACVSPSSQLTGGAGGSGSTVTVTFGKGTGQHAVTVLGVPGVAAADTAASASAAGSNARPAVTTGTLSWPYGAATMIAMEVNGNGGGAITWEPPFAPVPVYGGGVITMTALSSDSALAPPGLMVAGGDVEGFFTTNDSDGSGSYGDAWTVSNTGVWGQYFCQCACLAWSQLEGSLQTGGVVYACVGDARNGGGGFLASTDNGYSWTLRSSAVQFAGNHAAAPLPSGAWPRSTGNLLAQDATNGYLYAATYAGGVCRAATPDSGQQWGSSWTAMGPGGQGAPSGPVYCRSLALSPDGTTLFVATSPYNDDTTTYPDGLNTAAGSIWMTITDILATDPASVQWVQLTGLPPVVEEIALIGANIYAACGYYGVFCAPLAGLTAGTAWTSLNDTGGGAQPGFLNVIASDDTTPPIPGTDSTKYSYWATLAGWSNAGTDQVIAFCDNPVQPSQGGGYRNLVQLSNAAGTITRADLTSDLSDVNLASYPTGGGNTQTWWHYRNGGPYQNWLSGSAWTNACITIDQSASATAPYIYVTGDGGFYRYDPSGVPGGPLYPWQVAVNGLANFSARSVAIDPVNPAHLVFGATDWCSWDVDWELPGLPFACVGSPAPKTLEGGTWPPAGDTGLEGYAFAFDPGGSNGIYSSQGVKQGQSGSGGSGPAGNVVSRPNPAASSPPANPPYTWTAGTGLDGASGGHIPLGLAVVRDTAALGANQYLLAAVAGSGLWLMVNGGSWVNVTSGQKVLATVEGTPYCAFAVPAGPLDPSVPGSSCVYFLDRGNGKVWRGAATADAGTSLQTWTEIWSYGQPINDTSTGYLCLNPAGNDELWVTTPTRLVKIKHASQHVAGGAVTTVTLPPAPNPAGQSSPYPVYPGGIAMTYTSGVTTVYCVGLPSASSPSTQLFRSTNDGTSWQSVGGPGVAACAANPGDMAVSPDGRIYISSDGNVVACGYPASGPAALGATLHTGANEYTAVAGQRLSSPAPVTATGAITSASWIMLAAVLDT